MKAAITLAAALALTLSACRSHRAAAVTEQGSATATVVDTTRTVLDAVIIAATATDTARAAADIRAATAIRFVPDGGTLAIDSAGRLTLGGISAISADLAATIATATAHTETTATGALTASTAAGLSETTTRSKRRETTAPPSRPWHETALIRLGQGTLIAAILYLLFLYLHRRK